MDKHQKHRTDTGPDSGDVGRAADQRELAADVRESALDAREDQVAVREDAESERAIRVDKILAAAEVRDERAEARDLVSNQRLKAGNLDAWLHRTSDGEAQEARQLAWDDRMHSRRDRTASADDRDDLAEEVIGSADTENG